MAAHVQSVFYKGFIGAKSLFAMAQAAAMGGTKVSAVRVVAGLASAGAGVGLKMARNSMPKVFGRAFRAQGLYLETLTLR